MKLFKNISSVFTAILAVLSVFVYSKQVYADDEVSVVRYMVDEIRAAYYESSSQNGSKKPFNSGYIKLPEKIAKQMPVMDTAFSSGKLPGRTDLTPLMPPVADQGNQGSCAAFTLGYALKSFHEAKEAGTTQAMRSSRNKRVESNPHVFSPKYLYHTGKHNDAKRSGNRAWGEGGMYMEEALNYLKDIGIVKWQDYKYDKSKEDAYFISAPKKEKVPPAHLKKKAKQFRISSWARINKTVSKGYDKKFIENVKIQLAAGNPIPFGTPLDESFFNLRGPNCMWHSKKWKQGTGFHAGGHAMIAVGYDDSKSYGDGKGAILIQNSWGEAWGDKGLCWVSYPVFGTFIDEAYYAVDAHSGTGGPDLPPPPELIDTDKEVWVVSGFVVRYGDIIDAITPIYSKVNTRTLKVSAKKTGKRIGGTGGNEATVEMPGYFVSGIEIQRGYYFGAHEVAHIKFEFAKLGQNGFRGKGKWSKEFGAGNYIKSYQPRQLFEVQDGFFMSNIQAIDKKHTSGEVFLHNLAIVQKRVNTPSDLSQFR